MASGEVKRKVTIVLGVKTGDLSAIRRMSKEAEVLVNAGEKGVSIEKEAVKETKNRENAVKQVRVETERLNKTPVKPKLGLDDELNRVRKAQAKVAEQMAKMGREGSRTLDKLIQKEKELTAQIERRSVALDKARSKQGMGGGGTPARPGMGTRLGEGAEKVNSSLGRLAIPVAIITMAPRVASEIGTIFNQLSVDLFGSSEERAQGGLFTSTEGTAGGRKLFEGVSRAGSSDIGQWFLEKSVIAEPANMFWTAVLGARPAEIFRDEAERVRSEKAQQEQKENKDREQTASLEIELRERHLAGVRSTQEKERKLLDDQLRLAEDRVKTAQAAVDQEKKFMEDAKKAYGLLTGDEQQSIQQISKKATTGGMSTLSAEEMNMVRGNPLFAGLFEQQALGNTAGFDELVKRLGADEKLRKAESELKLSLEQKNEITVKLDALDSVIHELEKKLAPVLEQATRRMIQETEDALAKLGRDGAVFGR